MIEKSNQNKIHFIKIIVLDLDGTLLNRNKEITIKTQKKLLELEQKGYILVLASGRFFYELTPYIEALQMRKYHGYAVCANGLEIHDLSNNTTHQFQKLNKEEALLIMDMAQQQNITSYYNDQQKYYVNLCFAHKLVIYPIRCILYPFRHLFKNNHRITGLFKLSFQHNNNFNSLHKICFYSSSKKLNKFKDSINALHKPYVFYSVNEHVCEITHNSVGKFTALQYITQQLGLNLTNVLAFGDSGNDLELLQNAGIGVAMKNAFPNVKCNIAYQTRYTNQKEGVFDYLEYLAL